MPPTNRKPEPAQLKPFWSTSDGDYVRLYHGHVIDVLKRLPSGSVQCCVTSPPYFGLRDYGTATWEGGSAECDHKGQKLASDKNTLGGGAGQVGDNFKVQSNFMAMKGGVCTKCGAIRIDKQIGSEATPQEFVATMVEVFREVRRVLREDGCLWLNLGDSYSAGGRTGTAPAQTVADGNRRGHAVHTVNGNLPGGNLIGIPWRVALALQEDGWILRQDIIWSKPAPMPESVKNRCTKSHEYVFLLAKRGGYFYDHEAVREDVKVNSGQNMRSSPHGDMVLERGHRDQVERTYDRVCGANKRSVWTISPQGYEGAHFATFPPKLIEPMIKAGTSEKGCCSKCGAPWKRIVEEKKVTRERPNDYVKYAETAGVKSGLNKDRGDGNSVAGTEITTLGWEPTCKCNTSEVRPCRVLDPFIGSGTTCAVSVELGRWSWGVDLSEEYLKQNAIPRIEGALLRRSDTVELAGKIRKAVVIGKKVV